VGHPQGTPRSIESPRGQQVLRFAQDDKSVIVCVHTHGHVVGESSPTFRKARNVGHPQGTPRSIESPRGQQVLRFAQDDKSIVFCAHPGTRGEGQFARVSNIAKRGAPADQVSGDWSQVSGDGSQVSGDRPPVSGASPLLESLATSGIFLLVRVSAGILLSEFCYDSDS